MLATRLIQSHKTYLPSSAHTSLTGFPSSLTPVGQRRFVNVLKYLRENAKTHFAKNTYVRRRVHHSSCFTLYSSARVEDFERGNLWELHQISASCGRPFDPQFLQEPKPLPEELLWGYNLVDKDTTDVRHQLFKNPVSTCAAFSCSYCRSTWLSSHRRGSCRSFRLTLGGTLCEKFIPTFLYLRYSESVCAYYSRTIKRFFCHKIGYILCLILKQTGE